MIPHPHLNANFNPYANPNFNPKPDTGTFGYEYESVLCLNKMATLLGHANDTLH